MRRWWIAVFFLILAALACDAPTYDPLRVIGVKADPETTGHVYTVVGNDDLQATYRSDDYARTWARTTEEIEPDVDTQLHMIGGTLYNSSGQSIWTFPRGTYRFFFLSDDYGQYFSLPSGNVSNSAAGGVLYIGMRTEGVLTFPAPGEWYLSAQGIDLLKPLPLTITYTPTIFAIIVLALLIPPLPLIHAYLLSRVWAQIMPSREAWRRAIIVSLVLTLLAALAITVWLTDVRADYYGIVAVMTAITVITGAGITRVYAPESRRLTLWTGFVSLIVPLGVAAVWVGWLFIIPIVTSYAIYHELYRRLLKPDETSTQRLVQRLALRSLGVLVAVTLIVSLLQWILSGIFRFDYLELLLAPVILILAIW